MTGGIALTWKLCTLKTLSLVSYFNLVCFEFSEFLRYLDGQFNFVPQKYPSLLITTDLNHVRIHYGKETSPIIRQKLSDPAGGHPLLRFVCPTVVWSSSSLLWHVCGSPVLLFPVGF